MFCPQNQIGSSSIAYQKIWETQEIYALVWMNKTVSSDLEWIDFLICEQFPLIPTMMLIVTISTEYELFRGKKSPGNTHSLRICFMIVCLFYLWRSVKELD